MRPKDKSYKSEAFNMLAFEDIFQVGEEEMKKKNYKVSWLRKQKRKERKLNICQSIYEEGIEC